MQQYYNKRNLQSRVALIRKLHEFRLEEGSHMANHIDRFDELTLSMEALGDVMDEYRKMTIFLGTFSAEYE